MFDRLSAEPIYNTRAVVQRTGVPADTFRAWERRYGVPAPSRTQGNHRLYSERDIALITWLREQTQAGITISQAVALHHTQRLAGSDAAPRPSVPGQDMSRGHAGLARNGDPFHDIQNQLVDALVALDGTTADRVVEEALAMTNVENVCLYILQGALVDIGERWEHGVVGVAMEHYAAAFVQRKFGALFNHSNPHEGRGPIVAACVEGEQHEIGLLLTCLFLSRRGYKILYLGANMPESDLVDTVRRVQPPLAILSATREETARRLVAAIPHLKAAMGPEARWRGLPAIGYGGHIFVAKPELRPNVDGCFLGTDAREAVANVDRIFAGLSV